MTTKSLSILPRFTFLSGILQSSQKFVNASQFILGNEDFDAYVINMSFSLGNASTIKS